MDWSLSKLIRIEAGVVSISTNDVKALLALYRVTDPLEVSELVEMARIARRRTWWTPFKDNVPSPYASYIGLEAETSALRYFQPMSIPGLLQTRNYAQAVVAAASAVRVDPDEIGTRVDIRMQRQREVLGREHPPEVEVILDEGVLHRRTGGADVAKEQLRHLATIGERDNVTIRVLPFTAGDSGVRGAFYILEFPDESDNSVVYVESALGEDVIDRPDEIKAYVGAYERLQRLCLDPDSSLTRIKEISKKIAGDL